MVTGDSALQIITFFFFLVPLDVCLLLILHLSQQVDWASITSYIYIYTCTQRHIICIPKIIIKKTTNKQFQTPFSPLKCLSYKNLHDCLRKKFAWRCCRLMWDMQRVCKGAGVGVWRGMQPYSVKRGHGDGPIPPPLPIQMGLFLCS